MRKALGATVEDECRLGAHKIANVRSPTPVPVRRLTNSNGQQLEGNIGLLFTNEEPEVVTDWFHSFKKADFARSGNVAPETFTLPAGNYSLSCPRVIC